LTVTARCPDCGEPAGAWQRFCGGCGAALVRMCPACGEELGPGFRFCGACGAQLEAETASEPPPAGPGEERRWATVLFADLSGFTS